MTSQRACIAVDMLPILEAEAKERQIRKPVDSVVAEMPPQKELGKSRDKAAAATNVGARYVSDAKRIKNEQPAAFEKIKAGETTISEVVKEEKKEARKAKIQSLRENLPETTPQGEFNVIVIDPIYLPGVVLYYSHNFLPFAFLFAVAAAFGPIRACGVNRSLVAQDSSFPVSLHRASKSNK